MRSNTSRSENIALRLKWYCTGIGIFLYECFHTEIFVPANHIGLIMDDKNNYLFAAPGMHNIYGYTMREVGSPQLLRGVIKHGNRTIAIVEQGYIGYAIDNGQPVLFPPGIHVWTSDSLEFIKSIPLSEHLIKLGPYTIVTVDEGYVAISQNNGRQKVLEGGHTHFLNHMNWKFEKFLSMKIQTDELEKIEATSADNINMSVTSTVNWRIVDPEVAAVMAAETMAVTGKTSDVSADISKLRRDVLKQAVASLATFIGSVNYSGSFHVSASNQAKRERAAEIAVPVALGTAVGSGPSGGGGIQVDTAPSAPIHDAELFENPLYDTEKMDNAKTRANDVTKTYGIEILSINIISAQPTDKALTQSLAAGAVASAESLKIETEARGESKALMIKAKAEADSLLIVAKGEKDADVVRAQGKKQAAILAAEGEAEGISKVAAALNSNGGSAAAQQRLAESYMESTASMANNAKVIIVPDKPNDVSAVLATAMTVGKSIENDKAGVRTIK